MNTGTITALPSRRAGTESLALVVEDLARRIEEGQALDIEAIIAQHPEHEGALRQLLPAMAALAQFGNSNGAAVALDPLAGATDETGRLGDFRIIREIGRGGMGVVYEAEQISLGRRVALKVLPFAGVLDERQLKRFKLEAAAAAALKHPNIVSVYCVGCERGVHFYAMEYVEGQSLAAVILECGNSLPLSFSNNGDSQKGADSREQLEQTQNQRSSRADALLECSARIEIHSGDKSPRSIDTVAAALSTLHTSRPRDYFRRVAEIGIQAAEALDHAHQIGIVHRDIKPANLLLDEFGKLYITDFGLARLPTDAGITLTGDMLGTLRYMSPEQASGAKLLDERTDIYSLGVTLYELAALRPAFAETDRQRLIHQVVEHEPPLLRAINPRVPQDLQSIVLKAMAKDAVDRYRSAGDLVGELRRFLKGEPVQAKKPTLWQQSVKWCRRHPAWVSALVATCLIVILVLSVATMFVLQSRATALAEQERAEANLELARRAIDQMYARVAGDYAMDRPRSVSLQRDILERALPFYEELSQANRQSLVPLRDRGRALVNVSYICRYLDQFDRAESAAREAADVFDQLIKQSDSTVSDWKDLGRALIYQAYALGNSRGRGEEAFAGTRRAVDVLAEGLRRYPHDVECRDELARRTNDMANGLVYRHRYDEAEQAYQRVTELIAQIGDPAGASSRYRRTRAYHAKDFGVFLIGRRPRQAETMLREAVKLFEELLPDDFGDRWDLQYLNHSRLGLARLLEQTGREDEAAPVRQQAVKDAVQLADDNPRVLHFRADVLKILRSQLNDSLTRNDYGAAEVVCRQIIDHQQKLAISAPDHPLEEALAGSHKQLETIRAMKQSTSPTEER